MTEFVNGFSLLFLKHGVRPPGKPFEYGFGAVGK
jgi:hypothetical protein